MKLRIIISFLFLLQFSTVFFGQNLDNIGNQNPIGLSGSIGVGLTAYSSNRERDLYSPFSYTLTANPVLSVYGFSIPFQLVYSDKEASFRQPFNRFGATPQYKWVKLHLGYSSARFSDFTLAGRSFLGAGIELTPGIFRFGAVYGRFNRAIEIPNSSDIFIQPSFDRWGYAVKLGVGSSQNYFDLILFRGEDKFDLAMSDSLIKSKNPPAENLVIGVNSGFLFFNKVSLKFEVATSAWSSNVLSDGIDGDYPLRSTVESFFTPRLSSRLSIAGKASLGFNFNIFNIKLQYRRITPEFQSMGAYSFATDVENIRISPSFSLFSGKVRISGSLGFQRNNLLEMRLQNSARRIGSLNLNFIPFKKTNVNFSYSNFRMNITTFREDVLSDTFNVVQVSEQMNSNISYSFGNKALRNSINISGNMQKFVDLSPFLETGSDNDMLGGRISYRISWQPIKFAVRTSLSYSNFNSSKRNTERYGGGINISKTFAKNLRIRLGTNYKLNNRNGLEDGSSFSTTLSANYKIIGGHSVSLSAALMQRNYGTSGKPGISQTRGSLRYRYSF